MLLRINQHLRVAGEARKKRGIKDCFLKACIKERTLQQLFTTARVLATRDIISLAIAMQHSIIMRKIYLSQSPRTRKSALVFQSVNLHFVFRLFYLAFTCRVPKKWTHSREALRLCVMSPLKQDATSEPRYPGMQLFFFAHAETLAPFTPVPPRVFGILFHDKECIVFTLLGTLIWFVCAWAGDKDSIKEIKLFP